LNMEDGVVGTRRFLKEKNNKSPMNVDNFFNAGFFRVKGQETGHITKDYVTDHNPQVGQDSI
jgi:hypothetical protein